MPQKQTGNRTGCRPGGYVLHRSCIVPCSSLAFVDIEQVSEFGAYRGEAPLKLIVDDPRVGQALAVHRNDKIGQTGRGDADRESSIEVPGFETKVAEPT